MTVEEPALGNLSSEIESLECAVIPGYNGSAFTDCSYTRPQGEELLLT